MSVGRIGLHLKIADLIGLLNFEWHKQTWQCWQFLYCGKIVWLGSLLILNCKQSVQFQTTSTYHGYGILGDYFILFTLTMFLIGQMTTLLN